MQTTFHSQGPEESTPLSMAAPVLRANYTLRALPVPAGDLTIRLWYAPDSWRRGLTLFGVGILLLACLYLWQVGWVGRRGS